jgi:hypothetical protein
MLASGRVTIRDARMIRRSKESRWNDLFLRINRSIEYSNIFYYFRFLSLSSFSRVSFGTCTQHTTNFEPARSVISLQLTGGYSERSLNLCLHDLQYKNGNR